MGRLACRHAVVAAWAVALVVSLPSRSVAHDIPNNITVYAFVRPEGQHLRVLARVPFSALIDVDWPRRGPDLLDLKRAAPFMTDAATLWLADNLTVFEGNTALAYPVVEGVRPSAFADRSFESYERAFASLTGPPLDDDVDISIRGSSLDVLFDYPVRSERSRFSVEPRFGRLGIRSATVLRFVLPDGSVRAFDVEGNPGLIRLDPTWGQTTRHFLKTGFNHLLASVSSLLFLICLVVPFRPLSAVVKIVVSFSVGHSVTLVATGFGVAPDVLWFPTFIDAVLAVSVLYVALENTVGAQPGRRSTVALVFGLAHGFGFSFGLRPALQFAGGHPWTALLSFNAGIEMGQLLVLVLLIPCLSILFRFVVSERVGTIVVSALVAHTGWHWTVDRGRQLLRYQLAWPELTPAYLARVLRWTMVVVAVSGVVWLVRLLRKARRHAAT